MFSRQPNHPRRFRPALEPLEDRDLLSQSIWAYPGPDGRLVYGTDAQGNRLPDFSTVGYQTGIVPLPDTPGGVAVAVQVTLSPTSGDQTSRIQDAINQVSALPLDANGFRGAVLLRAGQYPISGQLVIGASGVVLRGEGARTRLEATGTSQRTLIQVQGSGSQQTVSGTTHNLTDNYVPVGATSFTVDSTANLHVGDTVVVHRPSPANWIHDIGMDLLTNPWQPDSKNLDFDRVITAITGNTVTVDAPLTNSFEQQYGGGTIFRYTWPGRLEHVGVSDFYAFSDSTSSSDQNHATGVLEMDKVENAWAFNVTASGFAQNVYVLGGGAKWVTLDRVWSLDTSVTTGAPPAAFLLNGQLTLVKNTYVRNGYHAFAYGAQVPGPNVIVDSSAEGRGAEAGPHQRWSTGGLFDNVAIAGTQLDIRNAGNEGTGHGWQGANYVLWNSSSDNAIRVYSPPTAQNWVIGGSAPTRQGNGIFDSWGRRVDLSSLYYAQLEERQGAQQLTLSPSDNAYVYDAAPAANFGGASTLLVKTSSPGFNRNAFLKLNLAPLPANVASVQLQLYGLISGGSTSTTAVQTNLYGAAANWGELSVTWNTQPALGALLGSLTATRTGQWFTLDVTDYVRAALAAGQTSVGFALHNPTATSPLSDFTANEAATNQPRFVVTPVAGAGPTAAAGTALTAGALAVRQAAETASGQDVTFGLPPGPALGPLTRAEAVGQGLGPAPAGRAPAGAERLGPWAFARPARDGLAADQVFADLWRLDAWGGVRE
jgi:hypothetical protein